MTDSETEGVIIPANQPMTLLNLVFDDTTPEAEPVIERLPIIAWLVSKNGWPEPIAVGAGDYAASESRVIELPAGGYQEVALHGVRYATLDEAIKDKRRGVARRMALYREGARARQTLDELAAAPHGTHGSRV